MGSVFSSPKIPADDEVTIFAAQTISFGLIHGVLLTLAGWLATPVIFRLLGATGDYLGLAVAYMGAMFSGAVFFVTNQSHNAILNASGDTKSFRNFLLLAFLLNLVYDPWFIYGGFGLPPLGLAGIAWGTVTIQALGTLYLHGRARRTGFLGALGWAGYRPRLAVFRDLAHQGVEAQQEPAQPDPCRWVRRAYGRPNSLEHLAVGLPAVVRIGNVAPAAEDRIRAEHQ